MSKEIEQFLAQSDWKNARRVIRQALRKEPESHWLLTRLSSTYYEERNYRRALEICDKAIALAPQCPLVLWDRAGTLEMLGRTREAMDLYRRIVSRGVDRLAYGPCGEGVARARGLHADALYRVGTCYEALGRDKAALRMLERSVRERGPGCRSIYPIQELRQEIKAITNRLEGSRPAKAR